MHCTLENAAVLEPYHGWSLSESIALSSEGQRRGDEMSQRVVVLLRRPQGTGARAPAPSGTWQQQGHCAIVGRTKGNIYREAL